MMPTHRIRSEESSGCTQRQRAKNKDMAFLAHRSGPGESELLDRLGHGFFGCSPAELEEDISLLPLDIATFTEEKSRRWSKACELRNRDGGL